MKALAPVLAALLFAVGIAATARRPVSPEMPASEPTCPRRPAAQPMDRFAKLLSRLEDPAAGPDGVALLSKWLERDPEAAAAWLLALPDDAPHREQWLLRGAASPVWSERGLHDLAVGLLSIAPPSSGRERQMRDRVAAWTRAAPGEAARWVAGGGRDASALEGWAAESVLTTPRETLDFLAASVTGNPEGRVLLERTLAAWSASGPAEAAAWLAARDDFQGESQWTAVMAFWTRLAVDGPAAWLESLAPGPAYDEAACAYCHELAEAFPETSVAWAVTISDELPRTRALGHGLRRWFLTDSAAARAWTETQGLPLHLLGIAE